MSVASTPVSLASLGDDGAGRLRRPAVLLRLVAGTTAMFVRGRVRGVGLKFIFGTTLKNNDISIAIYQDFLPAALAEGRYTVAPPPQVVGHSLEDLQHALDVQRVGVSARKVVVSLPDASA